MSVFDRPVPTMIREVRGFDQTPIEKAIAAIEASLGSSDELCAAPRDLAIAVLQAIREPSVAMIEDAYKSYDANGGSLRDVFMDMIDVALEEK